MENTFAGGSEPIVLLNLSDFHYNVDEKDLFESVFNSFLDTLSSFLSKRENKDWTPNCLTLVGDIAQSGKKEEYEEIQHYLKKLSEKLGQEMYILPVPGNHDKFLPNGGREFKDDIKQAKTFLEDYKSCFYLQGEDSKKEKLNETTKRMDEFLNTYFGPYSEFVSNCWNLDKDKDKVKSFIDTGIRAESMKYNNVSGIRLIAELNLCVVLLNTEWKYVRGRNVVRELSVGDDLVQHMERNIQFYRRQGRLVITLMHRSPYYLEWNEVYDTPGKRSVFDRIVDMSDLIICGHEHNRQLKRPDLICNKTQLFQNGIMYSAGTSDGRDLYSASLLYVDPRKRLIHTLKFNLNTDESPEFKWRTPNLEDMQSYWMESRLWQNMGAVSPIKTLIKEIDLLYLVEEASLKDKIKRLFYAVGELNPDKINIPTHITVDVLNVQNLYLPLLQEQLNLKNNSDVYHLILYYNLYWCSENTPMNEKSTDLFELAKKQIKGLKVDCELVVNFVFCNILY